MATYSLELLSGSTQGKGIKVTGTGTGSSVTIHTAVTGTTDIDLVSLWAVNQDADGETRTLTLEWGGTTDPDNLITVSIPAKAGPVFVCDRLPLHNGLVIKAFSDEANDVQVYGVVHRADK
jgi:hypothetical protein